MLFPNEGLAFLAFIFSPSSNRGPHESVIILFLLARIYLRAEKEKSNKPRQGWFLASVTCTFPRSLPARSQLTYPRTARARVAADHTNGEFAMVSSIISCTFLCRVSPFSKTEWRTRKDEDSGKQALHQNWR